MTGTPHASPSRQAMINELTALLEEQGIEVKSARGVDGRPLPPTIVNDGYGTARARRPDVLGFDTTNGRIVFGLVRTDRKSLDSEEALEEYNVFLDHNAGLGPRASVLYVMMPQELVGEFTEIMTHYVHREYWHRMIAVGSRLPTEGG